MQTTDREPKKPEMNLGMTSEMLDESRRITDAIAARDVVGKITLNVPDGSVEKTTWPVKPDGTFYAGDPRAPKREAGPDDAEPIPIAIVRGILERECRRRDDAHVRAEMVREILIALEGRGSR